MGFVVNVNQVFYGGVGVALRAGQLLVAQQLLNGAQVCAVGQQMGRMARLPA